MIKLLATFLLAAAAGPLHAVELGVMQNLAVNSSSIFRSSVAIVVPESQSASLWASTSTITPHLFVGTNGRVGIGTASPAVTLHVVGISSFTDNVYMQNAKQIYMSTPAYIHLDGGAVNQVLANDGSNALKWTTISAAPDGAPLTGGNIWVGNSSNLASSVAMSGDATLSNAGVLSIGADKVTNADIAPGTEGQVLLTNASPDTAWTTLSGDIASITGAGVVTLKSVGTPSTYRSVTTDAQGRVSAGTNPTTFSGYGLSDTSANLAAALTDETGTGSAVFSNSPVFTGSVILNTNATLRITTPSTPASATAACTTGDLRWDSNYIYVCYGTNQWKRQPIFTW